MSNFIYSFIIKKSAFYISFISVDAFLIRVFNKGAYKKHVEQYNSGRDAKHAKYDK